ncbi:MAG TPA: EscU/YscU/HrcU family type III secretion system export apparatus switch protein [Mariprofundaceae bacterium]|nr:EscU/YscU/HrcU family type III secretion system export apparatus switch protein [Mariprofundaceae bacterium]
MPLQDICIAIRAEVAMPDREAAVALGYDPDSQGAPKVLAAGFGEVARVILATAREHGVHIHEDANLAELLARVPVGGAIPEEAYQLVAELLAFLCMTDQKMAEKLSSPER